MLDLDRYNWPQDFGPIPLPEWVKADSRWKYQLSIAKEIVQGFESNDVMFLQAPTGAGKSLIGELTRRMMVADATYTCSTKALQDQLIESFPYAKVLKGRANYPTQTGALDSLGYQTGEEVTCADCNWTVDRGACSWCSSKAVCPYVIARNAAVKANLSILNTSYLLTDLGKGAGHFAGRRLTILDEADLVENEMQSHVEVKISKGMRERLNLNPPKHKTVAKSWAEWVEHEAIPKVSFYLNDLLPIDHPEATTKSIRDYQRIERLLDGLEGLKEGLQTGTWVYDGYDRDEIIFRPIRVAPYGEKLLWGQGEKFLLMSATILSADIMADELGMCYHIDRNYDFIDMPSDFPVENRQVHVAPLADMSFKNKATAWPQVMEGVKGVLELHPDERVLVHTVSYELAKYLIDGIKKDSKVKRTIISYLTASQKEGALAKYKATEGAVMIAPSMDRGIDLPGDMCRVQVLVKVPFPNIKDKRINARMRSKGGKAWYQMQTVRTIMQMVGRAVRSKDDWATTYILDSQFPTNLYAQAKYLFPEWWQEGVDFRFNKRRLIRKGNN